jgi:hypothetical protein
LVSLAGTFLKRRRKMESREEKTVERVKEIINLYNRGFISREEAKERVWELIYCTPGYLLVP